MLMIMPGRLWVIWVSTMLSASAQHISPPAPPRPYRTFLTLTFFENFDSEYEGANFWTARFHGRSGVEIAADPFILQGSGSLALSAQYFDRADPDNRVEITESQGFLELGATYPVGWVMNPYVAATLRTSITEQFRSLSGQRYRLSKFWDPIISQEGMGLNYRLGGLRGSFTSRIGVGFQQIRAQHHSYSTDDRETMNIVELYKSRTGIECMSDGYLQIDSTITFEGRLDLFSSFDELDVWMARYDSNLELRFLGFLAFNWRMSINHDLSLSPRTIFRHGVSLGLTYGF